MSEVLVVYATKHGSTREVAETITASLLERGVGAQGARAERHTSRRRGSAGSTRVPARQHPVQHPQIADESESR